MKLPPHCTLKQLMSAVEATTFGLENIGYCLSCGHEQDGCEPDARKYKCEECGKKAVYGAQEILLNIGV